jgi:DNA-binding XRE family transcriptional regulator
MITDKEWEKQIAQELLFARLELQKTGTRVNTRVNCRGNIVQRNVGINPYTIHNSHYTQAAIAKRIGISQTRLHNWEYGKSTPDSWVMWKKWARALGKVFELRIADKKDNKEQIALNIQRNFK